MDFDPRVAEAAAARWRSREGEREPLRAKMEAGLYNEVWDPERVRKKMARLTSAALKQRAGRSVPGAQPSSLVSSLGLERVVGKTDFLGMDFLELALAVSRFVGRVVVRTSPGRVSTHGTGFMVSPRLLLTNNHVLRTVEEALHSEVEFDYQNDRFGRLMPVAVYALEPRTFFLTSERLDFTLVAVREVSLRGVELRRYGWSSLIEEQGKAVLGDPLNIVQHPKGGTKQIVLRSNELVDLTDDFAHYVADTEPGSSGSPVYNDLWVVVALHHTGVPKKENGEYVAKDGSAWRPGMDPDDLAWAANEGVRVSSIVDHVKKVRLSGEQASLREEMLNSEPPDPLEAAALTNDDRPAQAPFGANGSHTWTVPLLVTVGLGAPYSAPVLSQPPARLDAGDRRLVENISEPTVEDGVGAAAPPLPEAISIDPDYGDREGYDPEFLGTGEKSVPLPRLSDAMKADAAVNRRPRGTDEHVLPYHHFSVVMNKKRKLAYFTAVNIDGEVAYRIRRDPDRWFLDPRIRENDQTGEAVYANNPLDRGHLVRRLDPAWGASLELAKVANDDTFHFTNCCPQHADFNQNRTTWAGLEDHVLDNAVAEGLRVSVFTGPVLDERDPDYRGVRLPRRFWKVVVMLKEGGALSATAYLLTQEDLLGGLEEGLAGAFSFGEYNTYQVPVRRIEELTGLEFGELSSVDPADSPENLGREALGAREIASYEDLSL